MGSDPAINPCPNPRCQGHLPWWAVIAGQTGYVRCGCGLHGPITDSKDAAIELWNRITFVHPKLKVLAKIAAENQAERRKHPMTEAQEQEWAARLVKSCFPSATADSKPKETP